jgi:hypothetical protein
LKGKGVVKDLLTSLTCTLTVAAGGNDWFVKAVTVSNLDGGAKKGIYETFLTTGGLNSAS